MTRSSPEPASMSDWILISATPQPFVAPELSEAEPVAPVPGLSLWTDEFNFLSKPGQADIQSDLFYDYRTNVDDYPKWQAWMRERQPRMLVIWGKYDPSFDLSEAEAYRGDVPGAQVHVLNAGHFALDTAADHIAQLIRSFVQ